METGGEMKPSGEIVVRRVQTAEIEAAIAAAANTTTFARAWLTAIQNEDGTVTTSAHGTANYSHRGERRLCHVSFEVEHDQAIEQAFSEALAAAAPELVRLALRDAAICYVAAENNSDTIGGAS